MFRYWWCASVRLFTHTGQQHRKPWTCSYPGLNYDSWVTVFKRSKVVRAATDGYWNLKNLTLVITMKFCVVKSALRTRVRYTSHRGGGNALNMEIFVFDITPRSRRVSPYFGGKYCLHVRVRRARQEANMRQLAELALLLVPENADDIFLQISRRLRTWRLSF
jgi:hypothetical protein